MELEFFIHFIRAGCSVHEGREPVASKDLAGKVSEIQTAGIQAGEAILIRAALYRQHEALALYINGLYIATVALSDFVCQKSKEKACHPEVVTALEQSFQHIIEILEAYYGKYLDTEAKICVYQRMRLQKVLKGLLAEISKHEGQTELLYSLKLTFQGLLGLFPNTIIQRGHFLLIQSFATALHELHVHKNVAGFAERLESLVLTYNLNSEDILYYFIEKLQRQIAATEGLHELRTLLYKQLEAYELIAPKPHCALYPERPSLVFSIVHQIEAEIRYCEQGHLSTAANYAPSLNDIRMQFGISVAQIACLLRLMQVAGIISNKNQTELLRFFAQHGQSQNGESISADSLRSKFYNIERSTLERVRDMLLTMIHQSRKGMPW